MSHIVVVGDCLLDRDVDGTVERVMPDAPAPVLAESTVAERPGGAGLAALLAARDGHRVTFVTALGADPAGRTVRRLLDRSAIEVVDLGLQGATPVKTRLRASGQTLARVDSGGPATGIARGVPSLPDGDAVLVSCYGRGVTAEPGVRDVVRRLARHAPVVWDPHPRGPDPVRGTTVATPNDGELRRFVRSESRQDPREEHEMAVALSTRWRTGIAVTLGRRGAMYVVPEGMPMLVPAPSVVPTDVCGAGDRFASTMAGALATGGGVSEAVTDAVMAASRFVGDGGAAAVDATTTDPCPPPAAPTWTSLARIADEAVEVAERTRRDGGVVVATGGCFDVLHAGHAQMLQAARALGDCLVVCLNSDASVRRLKGDGRPVVAAEDRARLLRSLRPVDGVVVFDGDVPDDALCRVRPDIFVKGGDYGQSRIAEEAVLAAWGGRAVTVPYLHGRSTTGILDEVTRRA